MHKNCVSFVQQGTLMVFSVSIQDPSSPHLHPFFPSHKFDNARMPNVHAFTPATASTVRIDRSRDSFPRRCAVGERARGNDIWKNGRPRNQAKSIARPFNVSALSPAIYHRAYITAAGSRNFAFFLGMCRYTRRILGFEIAKLIRKTWHEETRRDAMPRIGVV